MNDPCSPPAPQKPKLLDCVRHATPTHARHMLKNPVVSTGMRRTWN